jgi:integrase
MSSIASQSPYTVRAYTSRLKKFAIFVEQTYSLDLDRLIKKLQKKQIDIYRLFSTYNLTLSHENLSNISRLLLVSAAKNFLLFNDVDISDFKFRVKVRMPKAAKQHKEALDRADIQKIILGCSNIRLKTFVMLLAATGMSRRGTVYPI